MTTIKTPNVSWIDIKEPSPKELKYLTETYNIHPLIIEELKTPTVRSRAEDYNGYIYVALHFPVFSPQKKISEPVEIDFIITPDTLISVRHVDIEPLDEFIKKCKIPTGHLRKIAMSKSTIYLFYHIMKELYDFSMRQLDHIEEKIDQIEEAIFSGQEKEMLLALSLSRSDILNFLRTLRPHNTLLESLIVRCDFFEIKAKPYLVDLTGEHQRILNMAESHREVIEGLQTTNESLLNAKTNEIMKVLTIITFIILPLSFLASVFGMSSAYLPLVDHPNFFWIMVIAMALVVITSLSIFKHKKWL
ncbi:MAG: magnesium transporter CorA family protein [Patescibacteria group bacterium]